MLVYCSYTHTRVLYSLSLWWQEVGRKQVVFFCSEILGEEPDPTMLKEISQDEEGNGDEDIEAAMMHTQ